MAGRSLAALLRSIVLLMLAIGVALAHDRHGQPNWIARGSYYSPVDGSHCCGVNDCFQLHEDDVDQYGNGDVFIRSLSELVPAREVQWSKDGNYWRCKKHDGSRRCFFAPPPAT
jgi:hypothetical protein